MKTLRLIKAVGILVVMAFLLMPSYAVFAQGKEGLVISYAGGGYYNEITPGETILIYVEAANYSDANTSNIRFSFTASEDWEIEFSPSNIAALSANTSQVIEMKVTAPRQLKTGDHFITVVADSDIGRKVMSVYLFTKEGNVTWVWIGAVAGLITLIAFIVVYRVFGRD
ncbi:MAG: NEW3 domain-containing protein [Dehalococcoidales bacterium]